VPQLRFRIPADLRDYLSILSTGLHLVLSTATVPEAPEGARVRVRVTLSEEELSRVDYVAQLYGVSRNAAVVAALVWATRANVYPKKRSAPAGIIPTSPETSSRARRA